MHGRARIARLMLESEFRSDIINAKSNDGWTPLHVAAHYGRDSFVRLLLEFRAEVDPLSDKGTTPLQLAIIRERSSCVRILLDHSANIDIQNGFLLRYAVIKGNHSYCRMFLQRGADTNLGRLEDGQTPLHLSALRDDVLCAQMLYTYGADTNTRNYEGQTPVAVSVSMSGISRPCLDFLQEVTSESHQHTTCHKSMSYSVTYRYLVPTDCVRTVQKLNNGLILIIFHENSKASQFSIMKVFRFC